MPACHRLLLVGLFSTTLASTTGRALAADGVVPEKATFAAGQEVKILDPKTGGLGWYVVYTPKDYTPDREWPTMICYHGKNGDPTTWPFKQLTEGVGYIVIGMEYGDRENPDPAKDLENLKRIRAFVGSKLRIDPKLLFMGGFSQGGWSTSRFSDGYLDQLAGLVILGAGGSPGGGGGARIKGLPVFVGIGENDEYKNHAESARGAYEAKGAAVTFQEWKGLGHSVDTNDPALKDWLLKNGPQNQVIAALAAAKAAEKSGKLGQAFNLYTETAKMRGGDEAAERAKAIEAAADAKLADAEAAVGAKKYREAVRVLLAVAKTYAGSPLAAKAEERKRQIETDPAIKAVVEQALIDAKAEGIESQARAAEKAKDYGRALSLYQTYVAKFPKASHFAAVKARYDALKGDKAIQALAKQQSADRECKGWLSAADNYIKNNLNDKARPYLQKILDKYGDTTWGEQARERLTAIGK
jgi:acetyl esterase/lipase